MAYPNLIVQDDEFESSSTSFSAFHKHLQGAIEQYKQILTEITTSAISSGETHDALVLYMNYLGALEVYLEGLAENYKTIVKNFISDLEKADRYLYDAGISGVARDFTQETYEHLVSCLDDPWCSVTDSFGDWLYGVFQKIIDVFNWDSVKANLNSCHRLLLDYNDETKDGLYLLFEEAHSIDRSYGASIAGCGGDYYTARFDCISLAMYGVRDLLTEMAEMIGPGSKGFTVGQIQDRLGKAFAELKKYYDETVEVASIYKAPSIGEISDFASQPWACNYFGDFVTPILEYIGDIDNLDAFKILIFEMFGITTDKLLYGGDGKLTIDEIIAMLTMNSSYLIGKRLLEDNYNVRLAEQQLLDVLKDMGNKDVYSDSVSEDLVEDCRLFLKYYKKFGEKAYDMLNEMRIDGKKFLDGRTREAKQFKGFLESLGKAGDILKYGESAAEYLAKLFTDYSAGLEVIDSFSRNYSGDETVLKAVEEVRRLYNKEFIAWAEDAAEIVAKHGFDYALKELGKACPVVAVVTAIEEGIEIVGNVTGLGTEAHNMYDSLIYHELYSASYTAYGNALDHFKEQTPGTEAYEQAAKDLENCFNLHKNNLEKLYTSMAGACSGDKQAYYKYCARQASLLSMKDDAQPDILSFEEFCALAA